MESEFEKTATKPLPAGAKVIVRKGQRLAEWIDAKGKRRTAPVTMGKDGTDRIVSSVNVQHCFSPSIANPGPHIRATSLT